MIGAQVQHDAKYADTRNADHRRDQERHVIDLEQEEHAVHAKHDQFGVADPHDVDHAEDQVQPQRKQCQHATEQHAVDKRLKQIDVEDVEHQWVVVEDECLPAA